MKLMHSFSYIAGAALAVTAMPTIDPAGFITNGEVDPLKVASWAEAQAPGAYLLDIEHGGEIKGRPGKIDLRPDDKTGITAAQCRACMEKVIRPILATAAIANPAVWLVPYDLQATDWQAPFYAGKPTDPMGIFYRQRQAEQHALCDLSGASGFQRAACIHAYQQADYDAAKTAQVIAYNAEVFAQLGKGTPRIVVVSFEKPNTMAVGDARFVSVDFLRAQLAAAERASVEYLLLWGGYGKRADGNPYRIAWNEVPAALRQFMTEWCKARGLKWEV